MLTVKQYAESKGVTHQSVYKQLQTHADELEPHIIQKGRTRYLTQEAVEILEKYRESNVQIIERTNDKEKIAELEETIKRLLSEKSVLENKYTAVLEWKADKAMEIASAENNSKLLEDKTKLLEEKEQMYLETKKQADELGLKNKLLEAELSRPLTLGERLTGRKKNFL